jgi:hypothetical protein
MSAESLFLAIGAAWRNDLPEILPAAFLILCVNFYDDIDQWLCDNARQTLRIASTCAKAYPDLLRLKLTVDGRVLETAHNLRESSPGFHCADGLCSKIVAYYFNSSYATRKIFFDPATFACDLFKDADVGPAHAICAECCQLWRGWEQQGRAVAWQKLPQCFNLGTWDDLLANMDD